MARKFLTCAAALGLIACIYGVGSSLLGKDASGTPFAQQPIRQCINVAAALEAPPGENWGYVIQGRHFDDIRKAGFDTIRLTVRWSSYTGAAPTYTLDSQFLSKVEAIVADALDSGLQVMLNVTHFEEFNTDPDGEEARLFAIWQQLFEHFGGAPDGLIFEFLNEPHFDNMPDGRDLDYKSAFGIDRMNRINAELKARVRATQPNRWLVLGSSQWGSHYPLTEGVQGVKFDPDYDPHVITTFHYYEPIAFTHQDLAFADLPVYPKVWGGVLDKAKIKTVFSDIARYRQNEGKGMPVLLGEFGAGTSTPIDQKLGYIRTVRQESERQNIGWCVFDFASPNFGLFDASTDTWKDGALATLFD